MLRYGDGRGAGGGVLDEPVILLDPSGRARGTAPKRTVHGPDTPLHLGFSCYLFDRRGHVLVTRRAAVKSTWPSVWSNACCGHPQPGETLRGAVTRRLRDELGVVPRRMALAISDFTYRAVMDNGVVEHEVCPVVLADTVDDPVLNPAEVDDATWLGWDALCERVARHPTSLSPWSVRQITRLSGLGCTPAAWLRREDGRGVDAPVDAAVREPAAVCSAGTGAVAAVRDAVDDVLRDFLAEEAASLAAIDPALQVVADEVTELVAAGGKRLRPAFVTWGHRATGSAHDPAVAVVAAAVEMLHTFALLHDDVMDRALTRRGRPAARTAFELLHTTDGLAGDATRFGDSAAILAGDLAFAWADQLLDTATFDGATRRRVRQAFAALRVEVMAGQYLDLRLDGAEHADPETARRVALLKSGRYTVTRPLQLGLAIGEATPPTERALLAYGDAVGLAFQLRDDVLGLFGDPAVTGKSRTDDLRVGKRTLLMLRALELAPAPARTELARSLGDSELDDDGAAHCRDIVARSGALASIETLIRQQHAAAVDAVGEVPEPARTALSELAAMAVQRDR